MGYQPILPDTTNYHIHPSEDWIMCPACHRPISVYAHSCAHCGRVVPRYKHLDTLKWDNPNEYEVIEPKSLLDERPPLFGIDSKFEIVARMMDAGIEYSEYYMAPVEQLAREVGLIYRRGGINKEPFPDEPWNMALMHLYGSTISVEQLRREVGLIDGSTS